MLHLTIDDHAAVPVDEVACLAHDMRGSLSTIAVEVDILRMTADDSSTIALDIMKRNIDALDRLLGELVELARLAEQDLGSELRDTALAPLVLDVIERCAPTSERDRFELASVDPVRVRVVPWLLERVIANLVQNALKYGPPGEPIRLGVERRDGRARLFVHDRGISLAPDEIDRVFEKHRRGAMVTRPGNGLGLYICRKIVEQHGGSIGADVDEHGTTFYVELPSI